MLPGQIDLHPAAAANGAQPRRRVAGFGRGAATLASVCSATSICSITCCVPALVAGGKASALAAACRRTTAASRWAITRCSSSGGAVAAARCACACAAGSLWRL